MIDAYADGVSAMPLARLFKPSRTAAPYACEQHDGVCPAPDLRAALCREAALLRERDALLARQATLSRESDHRLLNNLQMVASLLSLQSRAALNAEASAALALAADRVGMIGRIHRHLHSNDGVETVAFKCFLDELCDDFTAMLSAQECALRAISVEGVELQLPATVAVPLGYVASELITNALKYGDGRISVQLRQLSPGRLALSVENAGPPLPEGFDPAASKGVGMRIIRSLVTTIGGKLDIARADDNQGTRFSVLFSV